MMEDYQKFLTNLRFKPSIIFSTSLPEIIETIKIMKALRKFFFFMGGGVPV